MAQQRPASSIFSYACSSLVLAVLMCIADAQVDLQCPSTPLTISDGTINFTLLSEGSGPVDATYSASFVSRTWYSLANGFVDTVRSGGLPYNLILPVVNTTFIQSSSSNGQSFNPLAFLQNFASWWAGILAVTLLGIVLAQCFCVCGCCFWCCRCCGNCGGGKYQKHSKNNDCLMFTFACILFLITLLILVAAVLSFFSNEQTFQILTSLQVTVNSVVGDTVNYISDTFRELVELICQLASDGGVAKSILTEFDGMGNELVTNVVGEINAQLQSNGIDQQLNITVLQDARAIADNITLVGSGLLNTTDLFVSSLQGVITSLGSLSSECTLSGVISLCIGVVNPVRSLATAASDGIPDLSDVRMFIGNLSDALDLATGQNQNELTNALTSQATSEIDSAISQARSTIERFDDILGLNFVEHIGSSVNKVLDNEFLADRCPSLDGFQAFRNIILPNFNFNFTVGGSTTASTPTSPPTATPGVFELSIGYVRQCIINASFDYIRRFDTYRYAFGIIVCSLSLVTILLIWIGITCGFVGFRKGRMPSERSSLSNCGGIFLLLAVGVTFLFGFFLLLLSGIFFFFGANSLKICQAMQGPNYELFARTIDSPEVRNNIQAFSGNSPVGISNIPSISGFFRQCEENNTALFTALNLGSLLQLPSGSVGAAIRNLFNTSQLESAVNSAIMNRAINIDPMSLRGVIQDGISAFEAINITALNATGIVVMIEDAIARADLNGSIAELRNLSSVLAAHNEDDIVAEINVLIAEFENIRDNVSSALVNIVNKFADLVQQLAAIQSDVAANSILLVNQIADQLAIISTRIVNGFINDTLHGTLSRSIGYIDQYIDHFENQLMTNVGGCQPIYGIYTQFHNVICRDFIDGLNGFWWSLGFCAILYIPLIIFATLTASYFRKKRTKADSYDDYPMKDF